MRVLADTVPTMEKKKVVSVVYDNSGSMRDEDRWAYANYAMRTFAAMMNDSDELYITYMDGSGAANDPAAKKCTQYQLNVKDGDIDNTVNVKLAEALTKANHSNGTPERSIDDAAAKLEERSKALKEGAEYWLVVLTDGEIKIAPDSVKGYATLADKFLYYAEKSYHPRVIYMGMGSGAADLKAMESPERGFYAEKAKTVDEIGQVMEKVSDMVSARMKYTDKIEYSNGGKTLTVKSNVMLRSISVMIQKTSASVEKATYRADATNGSLNLKRGINIKEPDGFSTLSGCLCQITADAEYIDAGTYEITFDSSVEDAALRVTFEPAVELRTAYFLNDKQVTARELEEGRLSNGARILSGCRLSAKTAVYEQGTNRQIVEGVSSRIAFYKNGSEISSPQDTVTLEKGDYIVMSSAEIGSFSLTPVRVQFTIGESSYQMVGTLDDPLSATVNWSDLGGTDGVKAVFTVYETDGNAKKEIKDENILRELLPEVVMTPQDGNTCKTEIVDGKIIVTPTSCTSSGIDGKQDVKITCSIGYGAASAEVGYTVILPKYSVSGGVEVGNDSDGSVILRGDLYGNEKSVLFSFAVDGKKSRVVNDEELKRGLEDGSIGIKLNGAAYELTDAEGKVLILKSVNGKKNAPYLRVEVETDGSVKVTPYREDDVLGTKGIEWWKTADYVSSYCTNMEISFLSDYGNASGVLSMKGRDWKYVLLYVFLPALTKIYIVFLAINLLAAIFGGYIGLKKFPFTTKIYTGSASKSGSSSYCYIEKRALLWFYNFTTPMILIPIVYLLKPTTDFMFVTYCPIRADGSGQNKLHFAHAGSNGICVGYNIKASKKNIKESGFGSFRSTSLKRVTLKEALKSKEKCDVKIPTARRANGAILSEVYYSEDTIYYCWINENGTAANVFGITK